MSVGIRAESVPMQGDSMRVVAVAASALRDLRTDRFCMVHDDGSMTIDGLVSGFATFRTALRPRGFERAQGYTGTHVQRLEGEHRCATWFIIFVFMEPKKIYHGSLDTEGGG